MGSNKNKLKSSDYVHLHNHTQYSLLDGLTKIPPLVKFVKDVGMEAIAITDHGTMGGSIEFYKECLDNKVKPIIGIETYMATRSMSDRDVSKDKQNYHLTLLAMNNQGYQNLMKLSTLANLEGFYYKPRLDKKTLELYSEGLICLSGCIGGEVGDLLRQNQIKEAKEVINWYRNVFGDRYYLEIQDHGHPSHPKFWDEQVAVNDKLLKIGQEMGVDCVLTCDAHYLSEDDQTAHEILLCVQTGSLLDDQNRMSLKEFDLHVTNPTELIERWGDEHPEVILNSKKIADRCSIEISLGNLLIPTFPLENNLTEKEYLHEQVYHGLKKRYLDEKSQNLVSQDDIHSKLPNDVKERVEYELGIIDKMGFNGYFLIISDFINWGKNKGIVFGPGRGSAAGSIVAYSLRITELDPLKYDLLFERFLNPERISMPDIDIDIQDNRRQEVIEYCIEKYGQDRVANIVTFGRMAARNAVRDVARVLGIPYSEADRLAKLIPPPVQGRHIPLAVSTKNDPVLKTEYAENDSSKKIFDLAFQLEGTIRSHGVHAAGVVIAPEDIVRYTPLEMAQKGFVATQYSMSPIEEIGLLKMDFLGLSNLTIINNTLRIIRKVYSEDIDINNLKLNDKKTYELLRRGDTTGVFQFESSGMKKYLKDLRPTEFNDIVAMGALYRPGPLSAGLTDSYIRRKNKQEDITYAHPNMKSALESTYGVLVYQEQFMQISRDVCGFSGAEADTLRKAIGKKKRDMMQKMETRFIEGAVERGIDRQLITDFWVQLLGFADYCFNKSHSACYGLISYQTAYLKANYPVAFMAALMSSDYDDLDRLSIEINECKHMGIEVLLPDINQSFLEFSIVPGENKIRFGLAAIKNVGSNVVSEIIKIREEGIFKDLSDFIRRVDYKLINKKTLESLIKSGALDSFGGREQLLENLDLILSFSSRIQKENKSGQADLFNMFNNVDDNNGAKLELKPINREVNLKQILMWEKELLGLYLSEHPLMSYRAILSEKASPINSIDKSKQDRTVTIGGIITDFKEITTKNGKRMAFASMEDMDDSIELVLFPKTYSETVGLWQKDRVMIVKGKASFESDTKKMLVDDAREVTYEQAKAFLPSTRRSKSAVVNNPLKVVVENPLNRRVFIRLADSSDTAKLVKIKQTIDGNSGTSEVVLVLGDESNKQAIRIPYGFNYSNETEDELSGIVGQENIYIKEY